VHYQELIAKNEDIARLQALLRSNHGGQEHVPPQQQQSEDPR